MSSSIISRTYSNEIVGLLGLLMGLPLSGRSDSCEISLISGTQIELKWNSPPLAPFLQQTVDIDYTLQRTSDFQSWTNIDTLKVSDPKFEINKQQLLENEGSGMFFRCQRTLVTDTLLLGSANLSSSQFHDIDLSGFDLAFSLLHDANFTRSDLSGADLFATFGNRIQFRDTKLIGVNLSASELRNSEFEQADLTGATARFAKMSGNNFRKADLRFVDFTGTDLFNTDLTDADLRGAIFLEADLTFVRFHGAQMDPLNRMPPKPLLAWQIVNEGRAGADLSEADLSGMILTHIDLSNTDLRRANITAVDFAGTDLRGADLRGTRSALVNLRNSILNDESRLPATLRITWEIVNSKDPRPEGGALVWRL